jgi:threonine synthase
MQGAPIRQRRATNRNGVFVRFSPAAAPQPASPRRATPSTWQPAISRIRGLYAGDRRRLRRDVAAESIDDESTLAAMRRVHEEHGRFVCPHTAVALAALRLYRVRTRDRSPAIVLATAHPAKFGEAVRAATGQEIPLPPALQALERLRRPARPLRADPAALVAFLHRISRLCRRDCCSGGRRLGRPPGFSNPLS